MDSLHFLTGGVGRLEERRDLLAMMFRELAWGTGNLLRETWSVAA